MRLEQGGALRDIPAERATAEGEPGQLDPAARLVSREALTHRLAGTGGATR